VGFENQLGLVGGRRRSGSWRCASQCAVAAGVSEFAEQGRERICHGEQVAAEPRVAAGQHAASGASRISTIWPLAAPVSSPAAAAIASSTRSLPPAGMPRR